MTLSTPAINADASLRHEGLPPARQLRLADLQAAYRAALRAANAELDRACRAAADEFGPQIDAARAELALVDEAAGPQPRRWRSDAYPEIAA